MSIPFAASGGLEAIRAAGLAVNHLDLSSPQQIRRAIPIARTAALKVKSWLESTSWKFGDFTGLPIAIYQNWLYEQNRHWHFTDGTLCVLWTVEIPNSRSDYALHHDYIASTRRDYNAGRHQADAPAESCVGYDRAGQPVGSAAPGAGPIVTARTGERPYQTPVEHVETRSAPGSVSTPPFVPDGLQLTHFDVLRSKINARLVEMGAKHAQRQISEFPWLYGALGQVPSDVMFICENPSLAGVEKAHVRTISGAAPTIEDQWCGGVASNCVKRFRPALCELGLKTTAPLESGGWRCYITNVIKEADVVGDFNTRDKKELAVAWADVLAWEIHQVSPRTIFTVGSASTDLVTILQRRNLIPAGPRPHRVMHYSNRGAGVTDEVVRASIVNDIRAGLA